MRRRQKNDARTHEYVFHLHPFSENGRAKFLKKKSNHQRAQRGSAATEVEPAKHANEREYENTASGGFRTANDSGAWESALP